MYFLLGMAPSQSYLAQLHHLEGQSSLVEEPVNPTPRYMVQKASWIFTFFYLNTFFWKIIPHCLYLEVKLKELNISPQP